MKIFQIISIFTFFMVVASHTPVYSGPFDIDNIKVDVEGENTIDAREKALTQARRSAFEVLIKRMVDADSRAPLLATDDQTIAAMVDSFEINREKLSKNRYLASVNVAFNERAVHGYLGRHTNMALSDDVMIMDQTPAPTAQPQTQNSYQSYNDNHNPSYQTPSQPQATLTTFKMRINLNGIYEWVDIQNQLRSINGIKLMQVNALNAKFAVFTVSYAGQGAQLQSDLNARGMQLYSNNNAQSVGGIPYILIKRG